MSNDDTAPQQDAEEANTKEYDFSADLKISPVVGGAPIVMSEDGSVVTPQKATAAPTPTKIALPTTGNVPTQKQNYREVIDDDRKWPFAFGATVQGQPDMTNPKVGIEPGKNAPASPPVKTIRFDGPHQVPTEQVPRPATLLQRDISAILPDLNEKGAALGNKGVSGKTQSSGPGLPGTNTVQIGKEELAATESQQKDGIKRLRTYENDVAEALSHRKASRTTIAIAESKKATGEERLGNMPNQDDKGTPAQSADEALAPGQTGGEKASSGALKTVMYALGIIILLGGGAYGGYYLYKQSPLANLEKPKAPVARVTALTESIIPSDSRVQISIDGLSPQAIITRITNEAAKDQRPNTLKEIALATGTGDTLRRSAAGATINALAIPVPDIVLRTLAPDWMLGIHTDIGGTKGMFAALRTNFFQNALSGFLGWERLMPSDLAAYIGKSEIMDPEGHFIDEIVKNKDVRAFVVGPEQKTVFLYSFIDNNMLIVADSEVVLADVITRLENKALLR